MTASCIHYCRKLKLTGGARGGNVENINTTYCYIKKLSYICAKLLIGH